MPTFMKDVLGYKLDQAGFLAAFPYLLMAGIVQSAGILGNDWAKKILFWFCLYLKICLFFPPADYARTKGRLSTTAVRKLFTCGSYACQFVFMSLTALLLTKGGGGTITFISLSLGCGGKSTTVKWFHEEKKFREVTLLWWNNFFRYRL